MGHVATELCKITEISLTKIVHEVMPGILRHEKTFFNKSVKGTHGNDYCTLELKVTNRATQAL